MRTSYLTITIILTMGLLAACGGGGGGGGGDDVTGSGTDATTSDAAGGETTAPADAEPETLGPRAIQVFGMQSPTTSFAGGRLLVSFRVYDPVAGVPLGGVVVNLRVEVETAPAGGAAEGYLQETTALTDGDGVVEVVFETGPDGGAVYRIVASVEGADEDAVLVVNVEAPPSGSLDVTFTYDGETPLATLRILLLSEIYVCDGFNPGAPPAGAYREAEIAYATQWHADDLPQSPRWVVLVVGLDGAGNVAAGGCLADIRVVAEQPAVVTVDLQPAGLHLPGVYSFNETLDLSAAAPADADALAAAVQDALADPRGLITEGFRALVSDHVDASTAEADPESECKPLWEADVAGAVEGGVPATAAWTGGFTGLGDRIAAALSAVTVSGEWTIQGDTGTTFFAETHIASLGLSWDGAAFSWPPAEWSATIYPIRLADETTTLRGELLGYDDFAVTEHALVLEPGRIAAALVTQHVLGGAPGGPAKLAEVATTFVDCPSVVAGLSGEVTECLAGYPIYLAVENLVELCEQVVVDELAAATALLEAWVTPAVVVQTSGEATVIDENQDLGADRIRDGVLTGEVTVDGAPSGAVTGTFSATK